MSQQEFAAWIEFYKGNPFDDYHRIYRPAAMLASMQGADTQEMLEWLQPNPLLADYSDADIKTLKAFGINPN